MKTKILLALILAATASLLGCDKTCLTVDLLDVAIPRDGSSKISMFFHVNDCEGQPLSELNTENINDEASGNFFIYENDKLSSAYESRPRISPKAQKFRSFTILLLDLSGSLIGSNSLDPLKAASIKLATQLTASPENYVAVYGFDGRDQPQLVVDFTNVKTDIETAINSIQCDGVKYCNDPSTNLYGAVIKGTDKINAARSAALNTFSGSGIQFTVGSVVVFTDGTDQANRIQADAVYEVINKNDSEDETDLNKRTTYYTIGLGGEVDKTVLENIGKEGYFPVANADQLAGAFDKIGAKIKNLANSFFLLEYCSPKRGGSDNVLKLEVRDKNGFTGEASTQFDAFGFSPTCGL